MTGNITGGYIAGLVVNKVVIQEQGAIDAGTNMVLISFKSTRYVGEDGMEYDLPNGQAPILVANPIQMPMPFELLASCRLECVASDPDRLLGINVALSEFDNQFGGVLSGLKIRVDSIIFENV